MECNKFLEYGMLYLYDELDPLERSKFEAHLHKCKDCYTRLSEIKETIELYNSLPEEVLSPSVLTNILEQAQTKKSRVLMTKIFRNLPRPILAGIGVIVIFVTIGYFAFQSQTYHLEWENNMDEELQTIGEKICSLQERIGTPEYVDTTMSGTEDRIKKISEDIETLKKELQEW